MHPRRRALSAGAVLTAAGAIVLSGSPAQADCSSEQWQSAQWQIGAQLGPAPIQLTGTGGPLASLLDLAPVSQVAVESAGGQNLLRLDAASVRTGAESPALPDDLGVVDPIGGVRVLDSTDQARPQAAAPRTAVERTAPATAQVDRAAAPAQEQIPLRADGAGNGLDSPLNWVPIEFGAFGSDGAGLPWATGVALAAMAAGVASVTMVARRRRIEAG